MKTKRRWPRYVLLFGLTLPVPLLILTGQLHTVFPPGAGRTGEQESTADDGQDPKGVVCFGYADMEYGVTSLYPAQAGRVVEIPARENEAVAAGAVLLRLDDRAARLRVDEAEAALESAEAQLEKAEKGTDQHRVKLAQQRAALAAARHRAANARHALAGKEKLQAIEAVGRSREDPLMREQVAAARESVGESEAGVEAEEQRLADLKLLDPAVELRHARAEVATMRARLGQARQALEEHTLRAPGPGTVLRVLVGPGDLLGVQGKRAAVQFCARGPRVVRAEVDQAFAARVAVGQAAAVADDVRSGASWRGRVVRVSDWYTQRRLISEEVLQPKDVRTLECLIALDDGQAPLRIGQRVRVTLAARPSEATSARAQNGRR